MGEIVWKKNNTYLVSYTHTPHTHKLNSEVMSGENTMVIDKH